MPKATNTHSTSRPGLPAELGAAVDRLKALAVQSGDALLTEGPVQPDHALLDLCSDALHLFKREATVRSERFELQNGRSSNEIRERTHAMFLEERALERQGRKILFHAKKMRATTPAGIYAKALVVRCSGPGAFEMAQSLATDMVACPALRASLWPALRED